MLQYALHKQYAHADRSHIYANLDLPHTTQSVDYLIDWEYIGYIICAYNNLAGQHIVIFTFIITQTSIACSI